MSDTIGISEEDAVTLVLANLRRPKPLGPCAHSDCPKLAVEQDYCEDHVEHYICECGQRLEDAAGTPGDGFCVRCR